MSGKPGRKPQRGIAKRPYSTKLAIEHIAFLVSLPNAAGWLERVIDRRRDYRQFIREQKEVPDGV